MASRSVLLSLLLVLALPAPARAAEALIAVATNFLDCAERLARPFADRHGHTLAFASGATGKLYAQIIAGAPFDAILAADEARPARLLAEGRAVAGSGFTYASGRLVLWTARADGPAPSPAALDPGPRRLAIANPALAPYGAAAIEVLEALGRAEALRPRIVLGENIGQAFAFVATGNAELGLLAASQLAFLPPERAGRFWPVPEALHAPIRQDAVLLARGARNEAARAFLGWLRTDEAGALIEVCGYARP
ncbi:MAG: molybdate ABC transporter substrate-binding protein [Alphaproteobacteria bacterium]|nr:molybdate ABC transporter substrate-binding protein [Alphaproteobacteria bacterium]